VLGRLLNSQFKVSRIRQGFLLLYYQKAITQNTPLVSSTSSNHKQDLVVECSYGGQENMQE